VVFTQPTASNNFCRLPIHICLYISFCIHTWVCSEYAAIILIPIDHLLFSIANTPSFPPLTHLPSWLPKLYLSVYLPKYFVPVQPSIHYLPTSVPSKEYTTGCTRHTCFACCTHLPACRPPGLPTVLDLTLHTVTIRYTRLLPLQHRQRT
jgi:hypothetical protein